MSHAHTNANPGAGDAGARRVVPEIRYTRDARVPISSDDADMDCGWQSLPIPPTMDGRLGNLR
jgi:hypothetical protein